MSDDLTMDSGALIFATLADVYLSSGMIDEAISILKDGLSRNPTYSLAKVILGRAYYIRGDIEQALKILEGEYKDLKDSENTNLYIGHCYRKLGEYEKATEYYNITLKLNPDHKEAKQGLEAIGAGVKETVVEKQEEPVTPPEPEKTEVVEKTQEKEIVEEPVVGVALPVDTQMSVKPEIEQARIEEPKETETVAQPPAAEKATEPEPVMEQEKVEEPEPSVKEKIEAEKPVSVVEETIKEEPEPPVTETKEVGYEPAVEKAEPEVKVEPEPPQPEAQKEAVVDIGFTSAETPKIQEPETVFPLDALDKPMKRLLNMKTVKGAFICSKDGLLIKNYYEKGADIEVISAMIAAIHNEAQEALKYLKEGSVEKFIIDKIENPLCVIAAGESLLAVVTQAEAKPGLVFVYARKIIEEIREILG